MNYRNEREGMRTYFITGLLLGPVPAPLFEDEDQELLTDSANIICEVGQ
jgi:hypothetical protein